MFYNHPKFLLLREYNIKQGLFKMQGKDRRNTKIS